jgi:hypothetical protein
MLCRFAAQPTGNAAVSYRSLDPIFVISGPTHLSYLAEWLFPDNLPELRQQKIIFYS